MEIKFYDRLKYAVSTIKNHKQEIKDTAMHAGFTAAWLLAFNGSLNLSADMNYINNAIDSEHAKRQTYSPLTATLLTSFEWVCYANALMVVPCIVDNLKKTFQHIDFQIKADKVEVLVEGGIRVIPGLRFSELLNKIPAGNLLDAVNYLKLLTTEQVDIEEEPTISQKKPKIS